MVRLNTELGARDPSPGQVGRGRNTLALKSDEARRTSTSQGVPVFPTRYINVRPLNGALVYGVEGGPLPEDWSRVPLSPGIVRAIKFGDLEEGEEEAPPEVNNALPPESANRSVPPTPEERRAARQRAQEERSQEQPNQG